MENGWLGLVKFFCQSANNEEEFDICHYGQKLRD
jgi:hypothetical protein